MSSTAVKPLVAIVRHAERADKDLQNAWNTSRDAERFPFDPPITAAGIRDARSIARRLAESAPTDCIKTSPYLRCIQTALVMAEELDACVEIDHRLAEVMNREACGDMDLDKTPWRPRADLLSALEDVDLVGYRYQSSRLRVSHARGKPPSWPESYLSACVRYAARFVSCLHHSAQAGKSCILVSHEESVKACARIAPASCLWEVLSVEFCGAVIADLSESRCSSEASSWEVSLHGMKRTRHNVLSHSAYVNRLVDVQKALRWTSSKMTAVLGEGCFDDPAVSYMQVGEMKPKRAVATEGATLSLEQDHACQHPGKLIDRKAPEPKSIDHKLVGIDISTCDTYFASRTVSPGSEASTESESFPFDEAVYNFAVQNTQRHMSIPTLNALRSPGQSSLFQRRTQSLHTAMNEICAGGYAQPRTEARV
eukprot:TRINITY_DN76084_c0_g1_i1.p1 TRINITY_DN76084_c0_g1~~TRINITY_DN76084_c0_g1_i1.p1  ORF type:complete len:425 (-),score=57.16 TRINITY_DN76084_c0_g1_i1:64-1338(-)